MKKQNNHFHWFLLLLLLGLLIGCRIYQKSTPKTVVNSSQNTITTNDSIVARNLTDSIFQLLEKNYMLPSTFAGKFTCNVETDKDAFKIEGVVRLKTDKLIWASLNSLLNIEIARMLLTPDSIFFVNRMNKTYFAGDYQNASQLFDVAIDFDMIQSFLLNKDFSYYEKSIFKVNKEDNYLLLSTPGRTKLKKYIKHRNELNKIYIQDIWIDPFIWKIKKQRIKEISNPNQVFVLEYSNFKEINTNQLFPYDFFIEISTNKKTKLSISFNKITCNDSLTTNFKIPPGYSLIQEK